MPKLTKKYMATWTLCSGSVWMAIYFFVNFGIFKWLYFPTIGSIYTKLEDFVKLPLYFRVYLGVRTCELFLCFVAIVRVRAIMLTSLFSLFYVTREFHRFLHRGRAVYFMTMWINSC